jgi:integrase
MWNLAQTWGFVPEDHPNPARGIQRFKGKPRDRWVKPDEMPKLAQAIDQEESPYVRAALWLYLLTGLRKNELLRAEWQDVDFASQILRVPETKSGRVHYVSLSGPAMQILNDLPREKDNPYVLPGNREGEHLVNMDKPWFRVRTRAKIADVRLHDLRRTVGSWLATDGRSLLLIGRVLNHTSQQTTQIYAHLQQDPIREAMERHASRIMAAAGKTDDGELVRLKRTESSD